MRRIAKRAVMTVALAAATLGQSRLDAQAPTIINQPTNRAVWAGGTITFGVIISGGGLLSYQWRLNGTNLPNNIITTVARGVDGQGTVFKISANGTLTVLHLFGTIGNQYWSEVDGAMPLAGLALGSDGYFYGTTSGGGANGNYGSVFKISTNGALTTLYSFGSITNASGDALDGAYPQAGLVQGSDGSFYGTTPSGGQGGAGTVFRLTIVPEFQAATLTNGKLSLTWSAEAGGTYQLQYNSDLSSNNWLNLGGAVSATGGTFSTTDSITNGPQRFYRLVEHWQ